MSIDLDDPGDFGEDDAVEEVEEEVTPEEAEGDDFEDEDEDEDDWDEDDDEPEAAAEPEQGKVWRVKDLSETQQVELSVDGDLTQVPLRELANGYLREQVFHRKLNQLHDYKRDLEGKVSAAEKEGQELKKATMALLRNPEALQQYMERHMPDEWHRAVELHVRHLVDLESKTPQERMQYVRDRDRAVWEQQLKRERAYRQQHEAAQLRQERTARATEALRAPLQSVMAELGNPDMSGEEGQAFWKEVPRRLEAEAHVKGGALDEHEIADVLRTVANRTLQKGTPAPKPAPRKAKPRRGKGRKSNSFMKDGKFDGSRLFDP